jgi:hypothetical protein
MVLVGNSCQNPVNQRAPEGHGILPPPTAGPVQLSKVASQYAFVADTSGLFSRTVFETTRDTNFNIAIRDFSVPPKTGPLNLRLTGAAALEMRSGQGIIKIANESTELRQDSIVRVPVGASIELINPSDRELILRVYLVEDKQR